ncbi:hypothetical protein BH11ACT5_BH11ACT5_27380 [soil metagenome]
MAETTIFLFRAPTSIGQAMMHTIDLRDRQSTRAELAKLVPRAVTDVAAATEAAEALIADVRARGEVALLDQAERLDGVRPDRIRIHADEIARAVQGLDPAVRAALE